MDYDDIPTSKYDVYGGECILISLEDAQLEESNMRDTVPASQREYYWDEGEH